MHILGKILAVFVILAAVCASLFTSKLIAVRNSYTAKVLASKTKATTTAAEIEKLEAKIDRLKAELFRSRDLWGTPWYNVDTKKADDDGVVVVNIGATSLVRQDMVLHGFEIAADGSSIYRGSFSPVEVRNDNARLQPNWRVTKEEVSGWNDGNWRWRNAIPPGHQENFDRQLLTIVKLIETLGDRRRTLDGQKQRLEDAESTVKLREAELVGGELLANSKALEPEFKIGLVAAVEQAEEERNKILQIVDDLRRQVRVIQSEIEQLQSDNNALVRKLPGANAQDTLTQKQ